MSPLQKTGTIAGCAGGSWILTYLIVGFLIGLAVTDFGWLL